MTLAEAVSKIAGAMIYPTLEAVVHPTPVSLAELLDNITDVQCTAEEFLLYSRRIAAEEAQRLITATLHRSLAYPVELVPLEQARALASQVIASAGRDAEYYTNCEVTDEQPGVAGWDFMVTSHTFESVLLCVGRHETALLVAAEED